MYIHYVCFWCLKHQTHTILVWNSFQSLQWPQLDAPVSHQDYIYIYGMNGTVILLCAGQFLPIWIDSKDGKCSRPLLHLTLMKFNYFQKKKRAIKWQAYSLRTIVRYTPTHLFPCYKKTCASSLICLGLHQPPVPNSYIHPLVESGKK